MVLHQNLFSVSTEIDNSHWALFLVFLFAITASDYRLHIKRRLNDIVNHSTAYLLNSFCFCVVLTCKSDFVLSVIVCVFSVPPTHSCPPLLNVHGLESFMVFLNSLFLLYPSFCQPLIGLLCFSPPVVVVRPASESVGELRLPSKLTLPNISLFHGHHPPNPALFL